MACPSSELRYTAGHARSDQPMSGSTKRCICMRHSEGEEQEGLISAGATNRCLRMLHSEGEEQKGHLLRVASQQEVTLQCQGPPGGAVA